MRQPTLISYKIADTQLALRPQSEAPTVNEAKNGHKPSKSRNNSELIITIKESKRNSQIYKYWSGRAGKNHGRTIGILLKTGKLSPQKIWENWPRF